MSVSAWAGEARVTAARETTTKAAASGKILKTDFTAKPFYLRDPKQSFETDSGLKSSERRTPC
jgi:hypothetical protein